MTLATSVKLFTTADAFDTESFGAEMKSKVMLVKINFVGEDIHVNCKKKMVS